MYAIRSYYEDRQRVDPGLLEQGLDLGDVGRITSYNVCYTKLLRDRVFLEAHDQGDGRDLYRDALELLNSKDLTDRIDPDKVRKANTERSSLVVGVSKR